MHPIKLYFLLLPVLLILSALLGIAIGSTDIPISIVLRVLASKVLPTDWVMINDIMPSQQVIIWLIRTPRVVIAALVGAALAIAGVQMQGLFQNPLASPDIVGTSSGGAFGAVIALAMGLASYSLFYLPVFAFFGAFLALFTVYALATRRGNTPVATLLLAGVALNALIGAMISYVITLVWLEYDIAREIIFWLMGGLDSRTWIHVGIALPGILLGTLIALLYTRELDILLMGQETAYSLGVEVEPVKRIILTSTALLTGTAVAVSGIVGFVGLIIPHIVRLLIGPKHRYLVPASALMGATFLILADLLARTLHRPEEIRLGILTAAFGAPFFLYLLLRHQRHF
ncbi:MAG TPA: iron ABC transporter [Gammaproteobacteria bacterium]|nr:iron ABC transporter [Gammaproteobacteria bacterium]